MAQGFNQVGEYLRSLSRRQVFWSLSISVLVAATLAYFKVVRPDVDFIFRSPQVFVVNKGKLDALINRVDGFLFWKGQIAFIGNMPGIRQRVSPDLEPEALQIGAIPPVEPFEEISGPCYLKLAVQYHIPGIPFFRYTSLLYLENSPARLSWHQVDNIPAKYRSLGRAGIGDVDIVRLDFQ